MLEDLSFGTSFLGQRPLCLKLKMWKERKQDDIKHETSKLGFQRNRNNKTS